MPAVILKSKVIFPVPAASLDFHSEGENLIVFVGLWVYIGPGRGASTSRGAEWTSPLLGVDTAERRDWS